MDISGVYSMGALCMGTADGGARGDAMPAVPLLATPLLRSILDLGPGEAGGLRRPDDDEDAEDDMALPAARRCCGFRARG